MHQQGALALFPNFTGIGAPYEAPEHAELHLDSAASADIDTLARRVVASLS